MTSLRQNLIAKFANKSYRDAFVAEQIFSRLPLKIRCLREEQGKTQQQLGDVAGMAQTWVSKLEDPNYGKLTIATLLKVASALDVALKIDFVPYSTVLNEAVYRTADSFSVVTFADDLGLNSASVEYSAAANHATDALFTNVLPFPRSAPEASAAVDMRIPRSAPRAAQPVAV